MNERVIRIWSATEAQLIGHGGITVVSEATGIAHSTIRRGIKELSQQSQRPDTLLPSSQVRRAGGGRKNILVKDPQLLEALEALVDPVTRGDPESPLRWTCKSTYRLADELCNQAHRVSARKVGYLLCKGSRINKCSNLCANP